MFSRSHRRFRDLQGSKDQLARREIPGLRGSRDQLAHRENLGPGGQQGPIGPQGPESGQYTSGIERSPGTVDVCYRAAPVQEAIFNNIRQYPCGVVLKRVLWEMEELRVDAEGEWFLRRSDFSDMPNIRRVNLEKVGLDSLPPDLLHDLTGLRVLELELLLSPGEKLPDAVLSGVPASVEQLTLYLRKRPDDPSDVGRTVTLPSEMFAHLTELETLGVQFSEHESCMALQQDTLIGISRLTSLSFSGPIKQLPRRTLSGLLRLDYIGFSPSESCGNGEIHQIFVPDESMIFRLGKACEGNGCEVAGLINE